MKIVLLLFVFGSGLSWIPLNAQTKITGLVTGKNKQPLPDANVLLLKAADSTLIKGSATTRDGRFSFDHVKAGDYLIMATNMGFTSVYLPTIKVSGNADALDLTVIELEEEVVELKQVNVQSRRPLLEQKIDRLVVNVKNSITSAGSSALDVLERSPGVIVNRQANSINMSGKEGVTVMINGKINYMPVAALVQMLEGMNAGNIDRIELITTPPAHLDAQGNAGYINIILLTNPNFGFNGSYSLSGGYGDGLLTTNSINFNYRKNKFNVFGDYSMGIDKRIPYINNYRRVESQGVVKETVTVMDREPTRYTHNARIGIDYQLTKKTMIGFLASGYINRYDMHENITSQLYTDTKTDTLILISNKETNDWRHAKFNLNLQHTIRSGEILSFDLDYLIYDNNQPFTYKNDYYDENGHYLFTENVRTSKETPIWFWVGKADYTKNINDKTSLEAGVKATISRFDNDVKVERSQNSGWQTDPLYTSSATLKEDITAGYLSFNLQPTSKTTLKLGLRYEYTNSNLGTATQKNIVDRHYGRLFPTFFVSQKLTEHQAMNFSYSRRINRPAFTDLAPFIFFFDPYTFISGNSALQPSISDNVKMDYTFHKNLVSLAYAYDNNYIAIFQSRIDPATNKQVLYAQNLDYVKTATAVVSLPIDIKKWWVLQSNFTGIWQEAGFVNENESSKVSQANINIRVIQNFQLPRDFSAELTVMYQTTSIYGGYEVKPFGQVDAGIQKKFRNNNEKLRLVVDDIFSTNKWRWQTNSSPDNFSKTTLQFNKATISLTWSRNFGRNTVKAARERNTGSAEESGRVRN